MCDDSNSLDQIWFALLKAQPANDIMSLVNSPTCGLECCERKPTFGCFRRKGCELIRGIRPFTLAILSDRLDVVKELVAAGATTDVPMRCYSSMLGEFECQPLQIASFLGSEELIRFLITSGCDGANTINSSLHLAAMTGSLSAIKTLRSCGAAVHATNFDRSCKTALHFASEKGHVDVVSYLLEIGCDPNVRDREEHTPLHCAVINGHSRVLEVLLGCGSDPNALTSQSITPLYCTLSIEQSWSGSLLGQYTSSSGQAVEMLLRAGANPDLCYQDLSPLGLAVRRDLLEEISLLLEFGSDVSRKHDGQSLLQDIDIESREVDSIKILIDAGYDTALVSVDGRGLPSDMRQLLLSEGIIPSQWR